MGLGIGIGVSLGQSGYVFGGVPTFTPSDLFAGSEQGAWFRPNVLPSLYQSVNSRLQTTTVGQPVGQMFDHSRGLALGSELVVNGDFSSGATGWSLGTGWTVPSNFAEVNTNSQGSVLSRTYSGANNVIYRYSANYSLLATPDPAASIQANLGGIGEDVLINTQTGLVNGQNINFLAYGGSVSAGTWNLRIGSNANFAMQYRVDDISIRQLLGNHSRQATAGSRPTLRQEAGSGVYFIEDDGGDSINWTAPAGTYTVAYVIPDGTVTILTGQSLSGTVDALIPSQLVEYVAVNRALTGGETTALTTYLQGVANP